MFDDLEARVQKLFDKAESEKLSQPSSKPSLILYVLAGLAAIVITFQTVTISNSKQEIAEKNNRKYYQVPSFDQDTPLITDVSISPELHMVGCAHIKTIQPTAPIRREGNQPFSVVSLEGKNDLL